MCIVFRTYLHTYYRYPRGYCKSIPLNILFLWFGPANPYNRYNHYNLRNPYNQYGCVLEVYDQVLI
ncbi:hypothetical protein LCGC14_0536060 [marine sediment metagenome]|uniref:Uncharacterized protein n=1 Tax=marine sediment metagenome TaxID=412755 RepID=A0A0F9RYT0_9ZZZZ